MKSLAICLVSLFVCLSAIGQDKETHDSEEIFYKPELTTTEIGAFKDKIAQSIVSTKEKNGQLTSKNAKGEKVLIQYESSNHLNEPVTVKEYPTLDLILKEKFDHVVDAEYKGYLGLDTLREIELATTTINEDDETYTFTQDILKEEGQQRLDLYFRYKGDADWAPLGKKARNLEIILQFDQKALSEFKKYHKKQKAKSAIIISGFVVGLPMLVFDGLLLPGIVVMGAASGTGMLVANNNELHVVNAVKTYNQGLAESKKL